MAAYPQHTIAPTTLPDLGALPDGALLRLPSILALCQCGRSTWFGWVQRGHAPQPVRIGPRVVAWRVGEIRAFLAGRARTSIDPNVAKATQARVQGRAAKRQAEAEKARRRELLL